MCWRLWGTFIACLAFWPNSLYCQQAQKEYPPAIEVTWTSSQVRTAEYQNKLAESIGKLEDTISQGSLRLKKSHKLVCYQDQVRYEFTGDIASHSVSAPDSSVIGKCTWVYNSRIKKTKFLNTLSGTSRKYPLGMIYDENILDPGPEMSLAPIIAWLKTTMQLEIKKPLKPREYTEMEPIEIEHNSARNECIIAWGHPDATTGKAKPMSFQGTSRMKFQILEGRRVPKSWTMEAGLQGKADHITIATLSQVNFFDRVDRSIFELDFPRETYFVDTSVTPNIRGVIDKFGNERGTTSDYLAVPHEIMVSENSPMPLLDHNRKGRRWLYVAGIAVTAIFFLVFVRALIRRRY